MITIETICVEIGVARDEVELWITRAWVRPDGQDGAWLFRPIDAARARLIHELRHAIGVNDEAVPLVLSLLDQLYEERRRVRAARAVLETAPPELRHALLRRLTGEEE